MKPHRYGPFPYSLISRRPPLKWPNGARGALWIVPNIEWLATGSENARHHRLQDGGK